MADASSATSPPAASNWASATPNSSAAADTHEILRHEFRPQEHRPDVRSCAACGFHWRGFAPRAGTARAPEQKQVSNDSSQQPSGPGRQLAHESREAAGEEKDEMAEFKESASVQLISKLTGLNLQQSYWLSVVLNFVVIAGSSSGPGGSICRECFATGLQRSRRRCRKRRRRARKRAAGWPRSNRA